MNIKRRLNDFDTHRRALAIAASAFLICTSMLTAQTSHVQASPQIVILPNHSSYITGSLYVVGEVINVGEDAAEFVKIDAAFYDEDDNLVAVDFTYTRMDVINPGRKSPFRLILIDEQQAAKVHHYSLICSWSSTEPKPVGLELLSHTSSVDEFGWLHVTGEINNTTTEYSNFTKILGTFYDENGTVMEVDYTYTDDLPPSQSDVFELTVYDEDRVAFIESYALEAESWQSVVTPPARWDITGPTMWVPDGKCDMRDVALEAKYFGSIKGDGKYDPRADITGPVYIVPDGKIDMRDIALVAKHYGEVYC